MGHCFDMRLEIFVFEPWASGKSAYSMRGLERGAYTTTIASGHASSGVISRYTTRWHLGR